MRSRMSFLLAAITMLACTASHAAPLFEDNFDTNGGTVLNWDGGDNWSVQNGTVDLVASGDYGIDCLGGAGHCVDLDGSSNNAGEILSVNLGPLDAGDYKFSYWLSGNQRNAQMDIAVALSFGDGEVFSMEVHSLFGTDGWDRYTQKFTLNQVTDPVYLNFSNLLGDNIGIVLDDVKLAHAVVAEPATLGLLGIGFLAAAGMRRRKRR